MEAIPSEFKPPALERPYPPPLEIPYSPSEQRSELGFTLGERFRVG